MNTPKKEKAMEPVTAELINDLVKEESDFAFEMKVLHELVRINSSAQYEHAGTYSDPVTSLLRQFDIRATFHNGKFSAYLAMECKNLSVTRPLIVHTARRRTVESWHCVIADRSTRETIRSNDIITHLRDNSYPTSRAAIWRIECQSWTPYQFQDHVGKSVDQIIEKGNGAREIGGQDFYQKYSQAINSCYDLIERAQKKPAPNISAVVPVLVIPDNTLWQIKYADDGSMEGIPQLTKHLSYYIDQTWNVGKSAWFRFPVSHLEIVTFSELENFMRMRVLGNEERPVGNVFNGLRG